MPMPTPASAPPGRTAGPPPPAVLLLARRRRFSRRRPPTVNPQAPPQYSTSMSASPPPHPPEARPTPFRRNLAPASVPGAASFRSSARASLARTPRGRIGREPGAMLKSVMPQGINPGRSGAPYRHHEQGVQSTAAQTKIGILPWSGRKQIDVAFVPSGGRKS